MTTPLLGTPIALTVNRRVDPLGLDSLRPEFGWRTDGDQGQAGWEIQVVAGGNFDDSELAWSSGWTPGTEPFGIRYGGSPLRSRTQYSWRVRVQFHDGSSTGWSAPGSFETGILDATEWAGQWVTTPLSGKDDRRTLYFRTLQDLPSRVVRGRAYTSALGWYRLFINGKDITGQSLVPRWTPFDETVEYQTYDITDALTKGPNTIGMIVSEGRFRGRLGVMSKSARYGDRLAAFTQIELDLEDGSHVTIASDGDWRVSTGRVLTSDPKFGERVDLRLDDSDWLAGEAVTEQRAQLLPPHPRDLIAEEVERVTAIGTLTGTLTRTPSGAQLVDFGQNFAGVARVRLAGHPGTRIVLNYGEILGRRSSGSGTTRRYGGETRSCAPSAAPTGRRRMLRTGMHWRSRSRRSSPGTVNSATAPISPSPPPTKNDSTRRSQACATRCPARAWRRRSCTASKQKHSSSTPSQCGWG
jgi:alpha-L-rhamnosidase